MQPGLRWIVWAFHGSLDVSDDVTNWRKHTQSGFQEVDFLKNQTGEKPEVAYTSDPPTTGEKPEVPYTIDPPTTGEKPEVPYTSDAPTTGASTIVASIVGNFLLFITAVISLY